MRVLVFEFICGGGCLAFPSFGSPSGSLFREGKLMLDATLSLLDESVSMTPVVPLDHRLADAPEIKTPAETTMIRSGSELFEFLDRASHECEKLLIIAPEIENVLHQLISRFEESKKLICPGKDVVRICSDKWETNQFLISKGVATPSTKLGSEFKSTSCENRKIIKPRFGAGSIGVQLVDSPAGDETPFGVLLDEYCLEQRLNPEEIVVQDFVSGLPASIALWKTNYRRFYFPAMEQCFRKGTFEYVESTGPLDPELQGRAKRLIDKAVDHLPDFRGYIGADICLGDTADDDCLIELNPRMTTSFARTNRLVGNSQLRALIGES